MPDEDVTVLPYREIKAIFEEYVDDMSLICEVAASQSQFYETFSKASNRLKVRLCRDTRSFCYLYTSVMHITQGFEQQRPQLRERL
jgi:hypothetical protein